MSDLVQRLQTDSPVRKRYVKCSSLVGEEEENEEVIVQKGGKKEGIEEEAPRMSSQVVLVEDHSPNISFYSPERRRCVEFSP